MPPLKKSFTCPYPLRSSSHLTSLMISTKSPLLLLGVSSLIACSLSPNAPATLRASIFSSLNVSMRLTLPTVGSITSSNALVADTVSPMIKMSAWGIVPAGSIPASCAPRPTDTPSQPPIYAFLSIRGAIIGCILRAPKLITCLSPAAFLHRAAMVATPDA